MRKMLCFSALLSILTTGLCDDAWHNCATREGYDNHAGGRAGVELYYKNKGGERSWMVYNSNNYRVKVWIKMLEAPDQRLLLEDQDCESLGLSQHAFVVSVRRKH